MLRLKIIRYKKSYDFKLEPEKPDSFENNRKNNSLDDLILIDSGVECFRCKCQTVANYCFGEQSPGDTIKHGDSVAPGDFTVRCFVPPRKFHGRIHDWCWFLPAVRKLRKAMAERVEAET